MGPGGVLQDGRDVVHGVEFADRDTHDKVIGIVAGEGEPAPVDAAEGDECRQREPPAAAGQDVVPGQRVQQRRGLRIQVR